MHRSLSLSISLSFCSHFISLLKSSRVLLSLLIYIIQYTGHRGLDNISPSPGDPKPALTRAELAKGFSGLINPFIYIYIYAYYIAYTFFVGKWSARPWLIAWCRDMATAGRLISEPPPPRLSRPTRSSRSSSCTYTPPWLFGTTDVWHTSAVVCREVNDFLCTIIIIYIVVSSHIR